jgi:hypothetical protein
VDTVRRKVAKKLKDKKLAKAGLKQGRGRPPKETPALKRERTAQEKELQLAFLIAEQTELESLMNNSPPEGIVPPDLNNLWNPAAWGFTGKKLLLSIT